jgi:hypothetical protein
MIDRLQQSLSNSGDPTTMSREQIGGEIGTLIRGRLANNSLSEADRNRLVALVAAQSGITRDEAVRRVTQMENEVNATVTQAEQKARAAADQVAQGAATAARALFTALVLGLLAALVGSWIGTRHKRVLHPADEFDRMTPATARLTRRTYEPSSVRVYDDADELVFQSLRDVSFPVSKQDLLRLARSGGRASMLHSVEGMPEGSYANPNEVLRALGMVH